MPPLPFSQKGQSAKPSPSTLNEGLLALVQTYAKNIREAADYLKSDTGGIKFGDGYENLKNAAVRYKTIKVRYDRDMKVITGKEAELREKPPADSAPQADKDKYQSKLNAQEAIRTQLARVGEQIEKVRGSIVTYGASLIDHLAEKPTSRASSINTLLEEQRSYATGARNDNELAEYAKKKPQEKITSGIRALVSDVTRATDDAGSVVRLLRDESVTTGEDAGVLKTAIDALNGIDRDAKTMVDKAGDYQKQLDSRFGTLEQRLANQRRQQEQAAAAEAERLRSEQVAREKEAADRKAEEERKAGERKAEQGRKAAEQKSAAALEKLDREFGSLSEYVKDTQKTVQKMRGKKK